jgi:hypothetical protein
MLRYICFILVAGLTASNACAVLTARFAEVDNSAALDNYVTQDLLITTTTGDNWGTAQLLTTLTAGSIYQNPNGSDFVPNPALFPNFPKLQFDSYLDANGVQPIIIGAAVNLDPSPIPVQEFSTSKINVTWLSTEPDDIGTDMGIGRFTLTDDAIGTWTMMVTSTSGFRTFQGQIDNGFFDLREVGPLIGDLDGDGFVGILDLNITLGDWNKTIFSGDPVQVGDISTDGFVGIDDLNILLAHWNQSVSPGDELLGDINGDLSVGIDDLNIILGNWNFEINGIDTRADPTGDNFIGIGDLNTVLGNWNAGTPPGSPGAPGSAGVTVPEPSTALSGLALAWLGFRRHRR